MKKDPRRDNEQWLAQNFPHTREQLENQVWPPLFEDIQIDTSRCGLLTALVKCPDQWKPIHSRYDPQNEAQRWASSLSPPSGSLLIFLGWGMGYHIFNYIKKHARQLTSVIVIEPEARLFEQSLSCVDFCQWPSHISLNLILGSNYDLFHQALSQHMETLLAEDLQVITLPFSQLYPRQVLTSIRAELEKIMHTKENMLRHMAEMGALCQANMIRNLPRLPHTIFPRAIKNSKINQPAIIVAAGPSLDNNLDQLHSLQNRAWLIAVDTSLRILLDQGIFPHCVVSKDPTQRNAHHFQNLNMDSPPLLAFDPQIIPTIPSLFSPPHVWLPHRNNALHQHLSNYQLTPEDHLPLSNNVALAAFNVAVHMGCNPILFMGLDLCFSDQSGVSHASGSALFSHTYFTPSQQSLTYLRGEAQDTVSTLTVEGIDGKSYPTIATFYEALRLLETLIQQSGRTCYDCSEGGAKIAGTKIAPLQDTLEPMQPNAIQEPLLPPVKFTPKNYSQLERDIREIIKHLNYCHALSIQGLQKCKNESQNLDELKELRQQIEDGYKIYHVLQSALERLMVEISRPGFWDPAYTSHDELRQHYQAYFTAIQSSCESFIPLYQEAADHKPH